MKTLVSLAQKFVRLKRHLHGLSLPTTLAVIPFMVKNHIMDFKNIGAVGVILVSLIFGAAIPGFLVEAYQGIFKGANRTKKEMTGAKWDIATVVIGWAIAVSFYYIIGESYTTCLILAVACILLEVYRLKKQ